MEPLRTLVCGKNHEGEILEAFIPKRRNQNTALKFLKKTKKRYGNPKVIVTESFVPIGCNERNKVTRIAGKQADG